MTTIPPKIVDRHAELVRVAGAMRDGIRMHESDLGNQRAFLLRTEAQIADIDLRVAAYADCVASGEAGAQGTVSGATSGTPGTESAPAGEFGGQSLGAATDVMERAKGILKEALVRAKPDDLPWSVGTYNIDKLTSNIAHAIQQYGDERAAAARAAAIEEAVQAAKGHDADRAPHDMTAAAYLAGRLDAAVDVRALATKPIDESARLERDVILYREGRESGIEAAAQIALEYRDEADSGKHADMGDPDHSLGQGYAANAIAKRIRALATKPGSET